LKDENRMKAELGSSDEDEVFNPFNRTVVYLRWMHFIVAFF
jgi:hypothetical protein